MKNLAFLFITLILLTGCPGGGDDGPGPPEDISGLWAGGGTFTVTYGGNTEFAIVNTEIFLEPLGNRQYRGHHISTIPDYGIYIEDEAIAYYDENGNLHNLDGSAGADISQIRGNRWHIEVTMQFGDIVGHMKRDLYRQ